MNLLDAKKRLLGLMEEYESRINLSGVSIIGSVNFLTRDFDGCEYDSKKLAFISADITIKADEAKNEDALIYALLLDAKRGGDINEAVLENEIREFKKEIDRIVTDICFAPNPQSFIEEELKKEAIENSESLVGFEKSLDKFTKYTFIAGIVTIILISGLAGLLARIL